MQCKRALERTCVNLSMFAPTKFFPLSLMLLQVPQTPMTGDSVFVSGQWPQSSSAHAQGSGRPGVRSKRSRKLPVSGTVDEHFLEDGKEEVIEVPDEVRFSGKMTIKRG